jgi:hypothetical protein
MVGRAEIFELVKGYDMGLGLSHMAEKTNIYRVLARKPEAKKTYSYIGGY